MKVGVDRLGTFIADRLENRSIIEPRIGGPNDLGDSGGNHLALQGKGEVMDPFDASLPRLRNAVFTPTGHRRSLHIE